MSRPYIEDLNTSQFKEVLDTIHRFKEHGVLIETTTIQSNQFQPLEPTLIFISDVEDKKVLVEICRENGQSSICITKSKKDNTDREVTVFYEVYNALNKRITKNILF